MEYWLLESSELDKLERGMRTPLGVELKGQALAYYAEDSDRRPGQRIYTVAGDTARIDVSGVLTPEPNFMVMFFCGGNTGYSEILDALAMSEADPAVKKIELAINSGGGEATVLFDVLAALQTVSKPITALVSYACSAAYAIASQAGTIIARNAAAMVGSIGVVRPVEIDPSVVEVTSTNAPKKRPDPTTPDGVAAIRESIDPLHDLFVETVAQGRGTDVGTVNETYGQGGAMIAAVALERGMIDSIATTTLKVVGAANRETAATGGQKTGDTVMDINELKASAPDVYAQAVQEGVNKERERVNAHITAAQSVHALDVAVEFIQNGAAFGQEASAKYFSAGMASQRQNNSAADDQEVSAALNNPDTRNRSAADIAFDQVFPQLEA